MGLGLEWDGRGVGIWYLSRIYQGDDVDYHGMAKGLERVLTFYRTDLSFSEWDNGIGWGCQLFSLSNKSRPVRLGIWH